MEKEQDYSKDIAEIRSMMERSSKFLSLSGWAGIMAGMYALAGAGIAYTVFNFNPDAIDYSAIDPGSATSALPKVMLTGLLVLILALVTAIVLSRKKAEQWGENIWNATSRRLLASMAVPLAAGGLFILIIISKGLLGLIAPLTLLFYGLALYNASKFTIDEVKFLGMVQIGLGLAATWFIEYGLLLWAIGFGVVHIVYGMYMYFRYER
ncbi:MAG: hypothetical protein LC662_03360 [Rhodothermaceae bacterium]|nr:hypothetical protein [Rhodothermaceae bacterium]